ncbi:M48 family metallopeptidase [Moheibacter lacus]|uniref:M48 family metalloprotease n=1 Tax=Moheibacter lacus TaxID=2745851 RepID=A0A838ZNQ5_9FLAO|nr:M48 family metallopeptidase [Moheibacter lacus]MBA5629620.1 M48 family metalloprotease [Moheibacter lacus]
MKELKLKSCIIFILIGISLQISAQDYSPIDTADADFRSELKSSYESIFDHYNADLKNNYQGKKKSELLNAFQSFQDDFIKEIEDGIYVKDAKFQDLLEEIVQELQAQNPEIPKDIKILISKHPNVNAYALPDGTLVMNMGSFKFLENEDQIASIIAHEIAHHVLKHVLNSQIKQIDDDISGKYKSKIKSIKQVKVGQNSQAFQLMQNLLYEEGANRRIQEKEADSLGFVYFQKAKFKSDEFINAFKLLQRYDTIKPAGLPKEIYLKYFDLPEQTFQESWLEMEDFSQYDYSKFEEKIDKDSISSHPEAMERITALQKNFPELKTISPPKNPSENFVELQNTANWEEVPNLFFLKQYGMAIFISLLRLEEGLDERFYKYWLAKSFEKVYEARKQYRLNRYLETVNPPEQSESYQQFLSFMWNLNLDELKTIADFYSKTEI